MFCTCRFRPLASDKRLIALIAEGAVQIINGHKQYGTTLCICKWQKLFLNNDKTFHTMINLEKGKAAGLVRLGKVGLVWIS